jgi:multiple sugar transport system substrate-binding protein
MQKLVVCSLLCAAVVFAFAGGQGEGSTVKDWTKEPVTLRIEAAAWILQKFPVEDAGKKFMQAHPNVKVQVTAMQDTNLDAYMLNWAAGDVNVDLAFGGATATVAKLAYKDLLAPWNGFFTGDFTRDKFLTHSVELNKKGSDYYALPFMVEGMALEANKAMMIDAGLAQAGKPTYPKTLDDLYLYAKKMTKGSGDVKDVYGFSWNFTNFGDQSLFFAVNCLGGKPYTADGGPNLDAPEIAKTFSFIKKVTVDGYGSKGTITDTNAGRSGYFARKVAIILEAASRAIEAKPQIDGDAIVIPFPGEEQNGSYIYAHNAYIPKASKVRDAAWAFMKEQALGKDFARFGADKWGKLPSLKRNYEGLSADFSEIQNWLANPKTIGDMPWVEGSKLNDMLWKTEQELVTTNLSADDAARRFRTEASKLNLSVVK